MKTKTYYREAQVWGMPQVLPLRVRGRTHVQWSPVGASERAGARSSGRTPYPHTAYRTACL